MENIYDCISYSDLLDNEIFINFKYDLVQINGIIKCRSILSLKYNEKIKY